MRDALIESLYECAFAPELWPRALDALAKTVKARGGAFLASDRHNLKWVSSTNLYEDVSAYVAGGWTTNCPRTKLWFSAEDVAFVVESDLWREEELQDIPLYREFLRPRGLGWSAGLALRLPTHDRLVFSLERDYALGPVDRNDLGLLEAMRPHLSRAALISARLRLERARTAAETLSLMGLPALVLNEKGQVVAANDRVAEVDELLCWRAEGKLALRDKNADALLRQALETLGAPGGEAATRSFALRDDTQRAAKIAHVCPVLGSVRDIFSRSAALLVLTPVAAPQAPPLELLRSLFDLTAAEARVAREIATGVQAEEIAQRANLSYHTIRSHIRGVLEKTGCSRQAEVGLLLANAALQRGSDAPAS